VEIDETELGVCKEIAANCGPGALSTAKSPSKRAFFCFYMEQIELFRGGK
jgi:hypothetical protein